MMIKHIDASSIHRICSGQVVVDLSTAVKELIENSLDAGATVIEVRLKASGTESIEIVDNGCGISPNDYANIAMKHCTSKIQTFNDLSNISSFGFRGEALNALCEISGSFFITTKQDSQALGTKLLFNRNGSLAEETVAVRATGTTVTVENLFAALPVRRGEFIRSIKKHYQKLLKVLQSYAIISAGVKIVVVNVTGNSRQTVLATQSNSSIGDNISTVFGSKFFSTLTPIALKVTIPPGNEDKSPGDEAQTSESSDSMTTTNILHDDDNPPAKTSAGFDYFLTSCSHDDYICESAITPGNLQANSGAEVMRNERDDSWSLDHQEKSIIEKPNQMKNHTESVNNIEKFIFIDGYVSKAGVGMGRSDNDRQYIYCNGRPVDLPRFSREMNDTWRRFEMKHKPAFVLSLKIPQGMFDVNVTPDKREMFMMHEDVVLEDLRNFMMALYEPSRSTMQVSSQQQRSLPFVPVVVPVSSVGEPSINFDGATTFNSSRSEVTRSSSANIESLPGIDHDSRSADTSMLSVESNNTEIIDTVGQFSRKRQAFLSESIDSGDEEGASCLSNNSTKKLKIQHYVPAGKIKQDDDEVSIKACQVMPQLVTSNPVSPTLIQRSQSLSATVQMSPVLSSTHLRSNNQTGVSSSPTVSSATKVRSPVVWLTTNQREHLRSLSRSTVGLTDSASSLSRKQKLMNHSPNEFNPQKQLASNSLNGISDRSPSSVATIQFSPAETEQDKIDDNNNVGSNIKSTDIVLKTKGSSVSYIAENGDVTIINDKYASPVNDSRISGKIDDQQEKTIVEPVIVHSDASLRPHLPLISLDAVWSFDPAEVLNQLSNQSSSRNQSAASISDEALNPSSDMKTTNDKLANRIQDAPFTSTSVSAATAQQSNTRVLNKIDFKDMRVIGQFNLGFIIAELRGDLYILDQHACDEKYRFEDLQRTTKIHQQPLIAPLTVETTISQELVIQENMDIFENNGFKLQFDENSPPGRRIKLRTVPFVNKTIMFGVEDVNELASMLIEMEYGSEHFDGTKSDAQTGEGGGRVDKSYLATLNEPVKDHNLLIHKSGSASSKLDIDNNYIGFAAENLLTTELPARDMESNKATFRNLRKSSLLLPKLIAGLASKACRTAVMIGTALRPAEMRTIVRKLAPLDQPWNCPHGRPTVRHLYDMQILNSTIDSTTNPDSATTNI